MKADTQSTEEGGMRRIRITLTESGKGWRFRREQIVKGGFYPGKSLERGTDDWETPSDLLAFLAKQQLIEDHREGLK
jgi:hypothetical protein